MAQKMVILTLLIAGVANAAQPLRVNGSTTVNSVATEAAEALRAQKGMTIQVDTQGGSSGGISGIGDGTIDIGMASKTVSDEDRRRYPRVNFVTTEIGRDAVALIVSPDVWQGGVRALTKQQVRDIYEGRIRNWKEVGGADRRIVFFNKEPGRGTWEVFAHWLYGDPKKAPRVSHPEVGANEETRNKVGGTRGAISQLSASWAAGGVRALAIRLEDGTVADATAANIVSGRYPMARPLFLVTNGPPAGQAKVFIDYVLSLRGQELVRKHGYLALQDLKVRKEGVVAKKP
ncbi:MAG TPA: substrate-binding domain-containing protein [Thermoanaerobaculia bacterium]